MGVLAQVSQEGLILSPEPITLDRSGRLTLKAKSPYKGRETAFMTVPIGSGMGQLMHQDAQDPDGIGNDRRDQDLMGAIGRGLARPVLTDCPILGGTGVIGRKPTGNPNGGRQGVIESIEDRTQFSNRLNQIVFPSLKSLHESEPPNE
jgi:hypothetical protein